MPIQVDIHLTEENEQPTIVTHKLQALWQLLNQILIKESSDFCGLEGAVAGNDAVEFASSTLLNEVLSVLCFWLYELSELTESLPLFVCTV